MRVAIALRYLYISRNSSNLPLIFRLTVLRRIPSFRDLCVRALRCQSFEVRRATLSHVSIKSLVHSSLVFCLQLLGSLFVSDERERKTSL